MAETFAPGVYDDVPEADYHSGAFGPAEGSLSHSGAKALLKSPALYRHEREHPVHKRVFDFGSAAHLEVLGKGDPIREVKADSWRTNAAKAAAEEAREAGEIPLLTHELTQVRAMADALRQHPDAAKLLAGEKGRAEVSAYAVDEPTGIWRRCRFDFLRETLAIDYKSAASAHPDTWARAAYNNGYYMQAPFYLDIAHDLGLDLGDFAFVVQEKDPPYLVAVYLLDNDAMELGRRHARRALDLFRECRDTDTWPGYSAPDNTLSLPRFAYMEEAPGV